MRPSLTATDTAAVSFTRCQLVAHPGQLARDGLIHAAGCEVRGQHAPGVGLDFEMRRDRLARCWRSTSRMKDCVDEKAPRSSRKIGTWQCTRHSRSASVRPFSVRQRFGQIDVAAQARRARLPPPDAGRPDRRTGARRQRRRRQLGQPQPGADLHLVARRCRLRCEPLHAGLRVLELDRRVTQIEAQAQMIVQRLPRPARGRAR